MKFIGGCACGALRYESLASPEESGYCHCRLCQKTAAAPVLVFSSFSVDDFRYTKGTPTIYFSTAHGTRELCSTCGTQIAFRTAQGARTVDVNSVSLDDPTAIRPEYHIWCSSQISWFDTADDLPRFAEAKVE